MKHSQCHWEKLSVSHLPGLSNYVYTTFRSFWMNSLPQGEAVRWEEQRVRNWAWWCEPILIWGWITKWVENGKLFWVAIAQRWMSQEESTGGRASELGCISFAQTTIGTPWKSPVIGRTASSNLCQSSGEVTKGVSYYLPWVKWFFLQSQDRKQKQTKAKKKLHLNPHS